MHFQIEHSAAVMMPGRFVLQLFDRKSAGDTRSQRGHRRLVGSHRNFDVISMKMEPDRLIAGPVQFDKLAFFHLDRALVFRKFARLQGEIKSADLLRRRHGWKDGAGEYSEQKQAACERRLMHLRGADQRAAVSLVTLTLFWSAFHVTLPLTPGVYFTIHNPPPGSLEVK